MNYQVKQYAIVIIIAVLAALFFELLNLNYSLDTIFFSMAIYQIFGELAKLQNK